MKETIVRMCINSLVTAKWQNRKAIILVFLVMLSVIFCLNMWLVIVFLFFFCSLTKPQPLQPNIGLGIFFSRHWHVFDISSIYLFLPPDMNNDSNFIYTHGICFHHWWITQVFPVIPPPLIMNKFTAVILFLFLKTYYATALQNKYCYSKPDHFCSSGTFLTSTRVSNLMECVNGCSMDSSCNFAVLRSSQGTFSRKRSKQLTCDLYFSCTKIESDEVTLLECVSCEACPPGYQRVNCGGLSNGQCDTCSSG